MSVIYSVKSNTPMSKTVYALGPATTFTVWTPASGMKVAITDLNIAVAAAGTTRILFMPSGDLTATPTVVSEFLLGGSANISINYETPLVNDNVDGLIRAVSGANGITYINLCGFEY